MENQNLNTELLPDAGTPCDDQVLDYRVSLDIGVILRCQARTEDEIEKEADDAQAHMDAKIKAKQLALTQFPKWVELSYVRKIKELDCFESVREMLMSGVTVIEVARHIHSLNEMNQVKLETLKLYLDHYKATIPAWMLAARQQPKQYLELKKKADEGIDCLKEMQTLYVMMKDRLEMGVKQERNFGILTSGMDRNFVVAINIIKEIDELKSRLGISDDQARVALPKHMSDQVEWNRVYSRESVQEVMNSPEKRSRVVQAAERLLDLYANKLSAQQIDQLKKVKDAEVLPAEPKER